MSGGLMPGGLMSGGLMSGGLIMSGANCQLPSFAAVSTSEPKCTYDFPLS